MALNDGTQLYLYLFLPAGVPLDRLSGLEIFEGPDPAFWCANDYAVVHVEVRGTRYSDGILPVFGYQEAEYGAEFVTWLSKQQWRNGKVALTGLAALAPWEGFCDAYQRHFAQGGIPFPGYHHNIKEWIIVPTYTVASWTNPVHTPESTPKWLRVHNGMEWPDYYDYNSTRDSLRFFDYYLKRKVENDWTVTRRVRLSAFSPRLDSLPDTVNRAEVDFPLPRTRYTKYFLHDHNLSLAPPTTKGSMSYDSGSGAAVFEFQMPVGCETTGYFMAHLVVSTVDHDEMDMFVRIDQFLQDKYRKGNIPVQPPNAVMKGFLKFCHDWGVGMNHLGTAFNWGPDGQMRGSFALGKSEELSKIAEPYYTYDKKIPFNKGDGRALDIALRPYGMYIQVSSIVNLIFRKALERFQLANIEPHLTDNKGMHAIHVGWRGQDSSYILVPHV
ncbi:Alpha/Beta hydrolase protein [Bisporella sp. PMI_857]|nr:Alpha/Beta hydrolase protein [Bisporella sp. PMI_857]